MCVSVWRGAGGIGGREREREGEKERGRKRERGREGAEKEWGIGEGEDFFFPFFSSLQLEEMPVDCGFNSRAES